MSNIYIQEPPTSGKVLLKSSVGDIDVELWSKECPKACRNFIQLCMEGYYDNTIFHRVIKDFCVQGGDPTGTGEGGESIYEAPFKDELHSRLRFTHRGLVAMAGTGNDNGSQFFFTLGPCPELNGKHTIFGKVAGSTLYNMLKLAENVILDEDNRPVHPHKIISTSVLSNPFEDIVCRLKRETKRQTSDTESSKKKEKGIKNLNLLSFGDDELEDEDDDNQLISKSKNKTKSVPDDIIVEEELEPVKKRKRLSPSPPKKTAPTSSKKEESPKRVEVESKKETKEAKLQRLKDEYASLKKEVQQRPKSETDKDDGDSDSKHKDSNASSNSLLKAYFDEQKQYAKSNTKKLGKGTSREQQTLQALASFQKKLESAQEDWMTHTFVAEEEGPILAKDANTQKKEMYDLNDPRNPLNERRRHADKKRRR